MSEGDIFGVRRPQPTCVGTGFIALDVLAEGSDKLRPLAAGGSCANVLTIMAYLGWSSYPIAVLGKDQAADLVIDDMKRWGVSMSFVSKGRDNGTPIVIERLLKGANSPSHRFEFRCPVCLSPLPRNRPVPPEFLSGIMDELPVTNVFYFDRTTRAALLLARKLKRLGALVMFEPSSVRKDPLFKECIRTAHIVKYSNEQLQLDFDPLGIPLEIHTLGAEGLRYRTRLRQKSRKWKKLEAFHVRDLKDSAGAGDWCSAGILHLLGQHGSDGLKRVTEVEIEEALRFGQALAALDCSFEGARGLMYELARAEVVSRTTELLNGNHHFVDEPKTTVTNTQKLLRHICPTCARKSNRLELHRLYHYS